MTNTLCTKTERALIRGRRRLLAYVRWPRPAALLCVRANELGDLAPEHYGLIARAAAARGVLRSRIAKRAEASSQLLAGLARSPEGQDACALLHAHSPTSSSAMLLPVADGVFRSPASSELLLRAGRGQSSPAKRLVRFFQRRAAGTTPRRAVVVVAFVCCAVCHAPGRACTAFCSACAARPA